MIWNRDGKIWYSKDIIDKIKASIEPVLLAGHCDNCDGCGYVNGCNDFECGMYQANKIWELLKNE